MGRKSSKDAILDATERVIRRQGMAGTTLEAVAAEAGLSKRALFYHFKNKKDMLLQLLERYGAQFTGLRQEIYDSLPDGPHRLLKATVLAAVRHPVKKNSSVANALTLLDDIELRAKVLEIRKRTFDELSENSDHPERVGIVLAAVDGLWIMDLFGDRSVTPALQKRIVEELLNLIDQHA
ncbi:MAG: TetR/AcrR family transcriptional regulator [Planctomycetaceae bacterium]|nr:TetR/AcrR family transcriptional regulator [Planctomycetaceae bacterium]